MIDNASDVLIQDVTAHVSGAGTNKYAYVARNPEANVTLLHASGLAENTGYNYGLYADIKAKVHIIGGSYKAASGEYVYGIYAQDNCELDIENAAVAGVQAVSHAWGLKIQQDVHARLFGGTYTWRTGFTLWYGVDNFNSDLVADSISIIASDPDHPDCWAAIFSAPVDL